MSRCSKCGRFMVRIKEAMGLPLTTGFPPDRNLASTFPWAAFVCWNPCHFIGKFHTGRGEYCPVGFSFTAPTA